MKDKDGADKEPRCRREGKESLNTFTLAVIVKSFLLQTTTRKKKMSRE